MLIVPNKQQIKIYTITIIRPGKKYMDIYNILYYYFNMSRLLANLTKILPTLTRSYQRHLKT